MVNKICTSIEQSKKLIELGIDVKTADLTVTNLPLEGGERFDFICIKLPNDTFPSITDGKSEKIPVWSLSALMHLMPTHYVVEKCSDSYCCYNFPVKEFFANTAVDAAFEMVCWLKENDKL